jgi:oligoribonuclease
MRFLAIDLETTGLLPHKHQILQLGAVIGDFTTSGVQALPAWEGIIRWEWITGHPFALTMNAELIAKIARPQDHPHDLFFADCRSAYHSLAEWLKSHGWEPESDGKIHATVAGKNVAGFDLPFLNSTLNDGPAWQARFQIAHRVFDVGSLYYEHGDKKLPDLKTCLMRAGVKKEVDHTAVADALDVIRLLRHKYGMEGPPGG